VVRAGLKRGGEKFIPIHAEFEAEKVFAFLDATRVPPT